MRAPIMPKDPVQIGPVVEQPSGELRAVVHPQAPGLAAKADQPVQDLYDLGASEVGSRMRRERLSRVDVDDGQDTDRAAVE